MTPYGNVVAAERWGWGIGLKLREPGFLVFGRFLQDEAVNHFGLQFLQSLLPRFNTIFVAQKWPQAVLMPLFTTVPLFPEHTC